MICGPGTTVTRPPSRDAVLSRRGLMEALARVSSRRAYNATLVIPVFNLDVAADFGRSLQVGPVTFMRGDRLRRSRVRWRLPEPWSYYEDKGTRRHRLIDAEKTYACTFIADESDDACRQGFRQVEGSLDVLRGSQLGRLSRDRRRPFGIRPLAAGHSAYYALAHEGPKGHVRWRNLSPFEPYRIDREWLGFLRNHYFLELLRRTKHQNWNEWEEKLWHAALLAPSWRWAALASRQISRMVSSPSSAGTRRRSGTPGRSSSHRYTRSDRDSSMASASLRPRAGTSWPLIVSSATCWGTSVCCDALRRSRISSSWCAGCSTRRPVDVVLHGLNPFASRVGSGQTRRERQRRFRMRCGGPEKLEGT